LIPDRGSGYSVALELAALPGGVQLIEEPEVHMHPGAIRLAAQAMLAAVNRGVQIVVSTHSLELIDALLSEATPEQLGRVAVFGLSLKDGVLKYSRRTGEEARFARFEIEADLR
jgi:predicted ATPase